MQPTITYTCCFFLLYRLFESHSELLELFSKFRELKTKESQVESLELQQHAALVMQTLDESIQALDNMDYFFDYVLQVGRSHRKIPGFNKEYFWVRERILEPIQLFLPALKVKVLL